MQLRDAYSEFQRLGVQIASVSVSSPTQARAFSAHSDLPFPLIADPDRGVIRAYGVYHFLSLDAFRMARPSSFLIDRAGRIRLLHVGANQFDRPALAQMLAEAARLV